MKVNTLVASAGTALAGIFIILVGLASNSLAIYAALSQIGLIFEVGALVLFLAHIAVVRFGFDIPFITRKNEQKDDN